METTGQTPAHLIGIGITPYTTYTATNELGVPVIAAPSGAFSVAVGSALRWAVYPCGYKWEIGPYYNRDEEPPSAVFRVKAHAEDFCARKWPSTGEVRERPNE
jgi:hypothetical protein